MALRTVFGQLANTTVGIAGVTLIPQSGGGLFWLLPAAITGLAYASIDSWLHGGRRLYRGRCCGRIGAPLQLQALGLRQRA